MLKLLPEIQNKDGAHLNTSAHVRFQNPTKTHTLHASSTRACLQHSTALKHTQNKRRRSQTIDPAPPHTYLGPIRANASSLTFGQQIPIHKNTKFAKKTWKHTKTDFEPFPWAVNMPWATVHDLGTLACSYTHCSHTLHAQITHRNSK